MSIFPDQFRLNGRTALITGSGRGLGWEIAQGLAHRWRPSVAEPTTTDPGRSVGTWPGRLPPTPARDRAGSLSGIGPARVRDIVGGWAPPGASGALGSTSGAKRMRSNSLAARSSK